MRSIIYLFFGILIISSGALYAQDKKVHKYCAEEMYLKDWSNCEWEEIGYGIDIKVAYNAFFKSYRIDYTDKKNERNSLNFYFESYGKTLGDRIMTTDDGNTVTLTDMEVSDHFITIELTYLSRFPSDNPNDCGYRRLLSISNLKECDF